MATKTALSLALGFASHAAMRAFGVEFALLLALLNYVPYLGALFGIALPVLIAMAQFAALGPALALGAVLVYLYLTLASVVEPALMGRTFGLSSLVVLLSRAGWTALWKLAGVVLAIPLASALVIALGEIEATRSLALLVSRGEAGH